MGRREGLSRRVVRWRNFARRRVQTMCRHCDGFYIYRGRRYENNDVFLNCVHAGLQFYCGDGSVVWLAGWLHAGPLQ